MNHCGHCGAFVPKGRRFCCDYCARRAAAKQKELRKPTVLELQRARQRLQVLTGESVRGHIMREVFSRPLPPRFPVLPRKKVTSPVVCS
jgi:predicted nucleic acid-binding Zn ribbon protein